MRFAIFALFVLLFSDAIAADVPAFLPGRARSVVEIWIWGGPSQLETFDPKPAASTEYNNGMKAIPTNVPGVEISEWLPRLATVADKYSLIRTLTHPYNGHETATYLMQTGRVPGGGAVYPAIGAVIARFKSEQYKGKLPPYIILTVPKGRFSEVGFLSDAYAPLVTGGRPTAKKFTVEGFTPPGSVSAQEADERFELAAAFDAFGKAAAGRIPALNEAEQAGETARALLKSDAAKAFDLSQEPEAVRAAYGKNDFGQSCLLARRLVERGVPYITINAQGWDSHKKHFETMKTRTAQFDQAVAELLTDLDRRKLLDTTIVFAVGEFGRTPKIDRDPPWNGGRNHYAKCFSALVAGGGFAGGRIVGVSDAVAGVPVSRPVTPVDFLGSLYELCGIDPAGELPNPRGLNVRVLPESDPKGRLRELYRSGEGVK